MCPGISAAEPVPGAPPRLLDPYTREPTTLAVLDVSERLTDEDETQREPGTLVVPYGSSTDYEHLVYLSTATDRPVTLPTGWTETG